MKLFLICLGLCIALIWLANRQPDVKVAQVVAEAPKPKFDTLRALQVAIAQIESHSNPKARRFEPHVFTRLTGHRAETFQQAARINWRAAMKSTSIGMFQILGTNCSKAGYKDIVEMFHADSLRQIRGFRYFIASQGLDSVALKGKWSHFARGYNGRGFKKNKYDRKLITMFNQLQEKP